MTPILVFDTETNGLPKFNLPSIDPAQPHITQLAAELFDVDSGTVLAYMDMLIRPEGWTIPRELEDLTGITNERADLFGMPVTLALKVFIGMWRKATVRVAHNEQFDARLIRIEMLRQLDPADPFHEEWKAGASFCTQNKSVKLLNLPPTARMVAAGRNTPKSPNLGEAYRFFTGNELVGAHNAAVDLAACKAVWYGINKHVAETA